MTSTPTTEAREEAATRQFPKIRYGDGEKIDVVTVQDFRFEPLMGIKTDDAARLVFCTALSALGKAAETFASLAPAMFAEVEPRDGVEATLVAQMTATHIAMTSLSEKASYQTSYQVRESCERSMTRLSRTFLAQMEALKKYRAKAQQLVRVERVTVNEGGQAIVGDVTHTGGGA
ncbi:hypothetical protein SAMN04488020_11131 [Palleronia marisminoris]|uniref:Uncharacterized protein n=1 Tax=Palleronia marisminoris TaxID=315423 RepID=A0A1Y5TF65_9RHOB|nr:hypothetical protein [Palleronia marisminoris]SFH37130.1 hypothetical protein SAMN04488020_11131 [Palleronia marisminoris]SLN62467.1 hypothetical protein PAM7066_03106 [Palleronia marisminoris]